VPALGNVKGRSYPSNEHSAGQDPAPLLATRATQDLPGRREALDRHSLRVRGDGGTCHFHGSRTHLHAAHRQLQGVLDDLATGR
jgi:hypothetical protein